MGFYNFTGTSIGVVKKATTPQELQQTAQQNIYAYVCNANNNTVAVINTATNTVVDEIAIETGANLQYIAITPPIHQNINFNANAVPVLNYNYLSNLTAQTTTNTTATAIGTIGVLPQRSGLIKIEYTGVGNNNTLGDGIEVSLYSGATSGALTTLLANDTYTQEGLAGNNHTFVLKSAGTYALNTEVYFTIAINSVTGGTASANIIMLEAEEKN